MSIYKELKRNPSRRDLLEFGLIFLVGMGGIAALNQFYWAKPGAAMGFGIAGAAVFALSLVPPIGRLLYIAWMALGLTIGLVTSPIIMFVVYAVVIVPVGLVFKVTGRDTMRRNIDPNAKSYWEDYPASDDPASYVRQF